MTVLLAHSGAADSCLCAIALVGDGSGWTAETRSMAHAITAIVAAQIRHANDKAKLAEGQALTSALIRGAPDAIVVTGPDRRIVTFNPAAEALFDRRRTDVLGHELEDLLLPERHRAEFAAGIRSYLESGDRGIYVGSMRHPAMRPDGTERMVELTPVPITVDGVVHFCGFMRDISELELAHAALADSESRFRVLAQLAPVGMVQMDAGGLCTFANDRWCEMTGMTAADAIGIGWASALHPDDAVRMEREWALAAARGTELRTDCRLVSGSGREIWVHAAAVPLMTAEGLAVRLPGRRHRRLGPQAGGGRAGTAAGRGAVGPAQPRRPDRAPEQPDLQRDPRDHGPRRERPDHAGQPELLRPVRHHDAGRAAGRHPRRGTGRAGQDRLRGPGRVPAPDGPAARGAAADRGRAVQLRGRADHRG